MNKLLKILIPILIITFSILNVVFPNSIYASSDLEDPLNFINLGPGGWLDGLLGIVNYPIKILLLVPGVLINLALSGMASIGGQWDTITLEKIFFNQLNITNINIFDIGESAGAIQTIRQSIAGFYVAFRNLAIVLSLAVLIYIGIQMALNSTADDKAKYKQMLINWVVGFGLIFILHYIIIITINVNEMLVGAMQVKELNNDFMSKLLERAWWIPLTTSYASIVMYSGLLIMTFVFLIIYIKRMLTISFLIVVAPLISVTYSIDKIDNNRSEILNTWIKEFMYNILIQPFHCIIYSVFIGIAMDLVYKTGSLDFGAMILAMILTFSIFLGQKIIREIFGFSNANSLTEKIAVISLATQTVSNVKNIVALRGSKNDNKVKNDPMPSGETANPEHLVRMRKLAEINRQEEKEEKPLRESTNTLGTKENKTKLDTTRKLKVKKRRALKNAPAVVKKVGRWYVDTLKTTTGVEYISSKWKGYKQKKALQMSEEDYFIAASEDFRQAQKNPMTNEQLAQKMLELYDRKDGFKGLNAEETKYKMFITKMQSNFSKEEMIGLIKNGSGDNKKWEK